MKSLKECFANPWDAFADKHHSMRQCGKKRALTQGESK